MPKSACRPVAMMLVTVRKAWLSAKPDSRHRNMAHRAREGGAGSAAGSAVGVAGWGTARGLGGRRRERAGFLEREDTSLANLRTVGGHAADMRGHGQLVCRVP